MNPLVECCEQNIAKGENKLSDDPFIQQHADLVTYSCMNECVLCAQTFFALVEGERLTAATVEELIEKIKLAVIEWYNEMQ